MLQFTKRLPIQLVDDSIFEIRVLPITKLEEFSSTHKLLCDELKDEAYKEITIFEAYSSRPLFKHYVSSLLDLVGLSFEQLDATTLFSLLFPHQMDDGSYERQGKLLKFLFGEVKGGSTVPADTVSAYAKAIAQLWHMSESFEDTLRVLNTLNYEDLNTILEQRGELAKSPEQKAKEQAQAKAKSAQEQLASKLQAGERLVLGDEIDINSLL